jgi:tripartite ATP-independent transporter DctP family solute receptor
MIKTCMLTLAAGGLLLATQPAAAQIQIRIAHATPETSPIHRAMEHFRTTLEERSGGEFQVQIFPGGQLGSVNETTELVQGGNLEMTMGASVLLSPTVPELGVLDQFLLFEDEEHARAVLDGEGGQAILDAMEARDLKGLGFMELGFRHFSNSRAPLETLDDFAGLRMRSADNPVQIAAWRSIDAVPIPLAWGEIYPSLQQGLIDGQESALSSIYIERFFEVQDYVTLTGHIYWPEVWFANLAFFDNLSEEQQDMLMEAVRDTVAMQRDLAKETNEATIAQLEGEGLAVNELDPEARRAMAERMNAAVEESIVGAVGREFFDDFMSRVGGGS